MNSANVEIDLGAIDGQRVTNWLNPHEFCGHTRFGKKCTTNSRWVKFEVDELNAKGIRACFANCLGKVAVFRLFDGQTEDGLQDRIDEKARNAEVVDIEES